MRKYNTVIIGGGPAGYTAALYAARAGLSVIVLEMLAPGGQMATTTEIDNYPGFDETVDGFDLAQKMKAGAERFGAESEFAEVTSLELEPVPKKVHTTSETFEADTVILSTGAAPRELGVEHEGELRGRGKGSILLRHLRRYDVQKQNRHRCRRRKHGCGGRSLSLKALQKGIHRPQT